MTGLLSKRELVSFTRSLVKVDSVNGNEREVADVLLEKLRSHGVKARLFGREKDRNGVIAVIKGSGEGKTLMLNGHLDTVPFGDLSKWRYHPLSAKIVGNKIYGRGSYDMKAGVAALTLTALDILEGDEVFDGKILLVFTYDEEAGHHGIKQIMGSIKADACIIGEPSDLKVKIGYRGVYRFELETFGRIAHTGHLKGEGLNAVAKMAKLIVALEKTRFNYRRHEKFPLPSITPGTVITGGYAINVIPDSCRALVDCRLSYGQTKKSAREDVVDVIKKALEKDRYIRYKINDLTYVPPFLTNPQQELVCILARNAEKELGYKPEKIISGSASDGNIIHQSGIPTVVFGPSGGVSHMENECVDIPSLLKTAKIYRQTILAYLR